MNTTSLPTQSELQELIGYLTPPEKEELDRLLTAPQATWSPNPGPQTQVIDCPAFEILYGGAAGGGKTCLLINMARLYHHSSLLMRRTYPDIEESFAIESRKWYGDPKRYNAGKYFWILPDKRRVRFGHMDRETDYFKYQSAEYDLLGMDELTQFSQTQYEYMLSRLRTTRPGQRVRVVACTNPGGEGHGWVKERWGAWLDNKHPNPAKPGELRWYKRGEDGRSVETTPDDPDAKSRTFIPAMLSDNPYLGDDYRAILSILPEPFRSQLRNGDWSAGETDSAYQVIPTAWARAAMDRWTQLGHDRLNVLGCDSAHGGRDKTVLAYLDHTGIYRLDKHRGTDTPDSQSVVALIAIALEHGGQCAIDAMPPGAYDLAHGAGLNVEAINFGGGSKETDRSGQFHFANKRAEMYWKLRETLDPDGENKEFALPPDSELLGDLTAPRWKPEIRGITIESKDDIKKRLGRSPDCGDAVVLAVSGLRAATYDDLFYIP